MPTAAGVTGESRLRLFPVIVKSSAGEYLIIRRDTGRMVQTSEGGVESIRLLQKGLTIDDARAALGARYGCSPAEVDIMPLVECLVDSDFVREIDGRRISTADSRVAAVVRGLFAAYVQAPAISSLMARAPLELTLRVMLRARPGRDRALVARIAENMRRVPAVARAGVDLERLASDNCAASRGFYYERLLLAALPPAVLDRWLRTRTWIEGTGHLDSALAGGRGAIVCAFHEAAYSMIPFMLASRGYAQSMLMDASVDSVTQIQARLAELHASGYPYGLEPVSLDHGLRRLVGRLKEGRTVLLMFDPTVAEEQAHVKVPFLGGSLRVARGTAWLAARTGAPLLPVTIASTARGRYRAAIHPPVNGSHETELSMLAALARVLEREVLARPAAWLKWKDFDIMAGGTGNPSRCAEACHA